MSTDRKKVLSDQTLQIIPFLKTSKQSRVFLKVGIKRIIKDNLRQGDVSNLIVKGMNIEAATKHLGYEIIEITQKRYTYIFLRK